MLIGISKSIAELIKAVEKKIVEDEKKLSELRREYRDLENDLTYDPPERGVPDDRLGDIRQLGQQIIEAERNLDFLKIKLEEMKETEDKEQKLTLSLNDCILFGVKDN